MGQLLLEKCNGHHDDAEDHSLRLTCASPAGTAIEGVVDIKGHQTALRRHAVGQCQVLVKELEAVGNGQEVQNVMEGISMGSLTKRSVCHALAPSMEAASISSSGMDCRPLM